MGMRRKHNAKGRDDRSEQYLALSYRTLRHPSWRSLSGAAVKVYLELRSRYHGGNNGKLSLSLEEGAKLLGLGKMTISRAFQELERKGFIVMMKQGHWYGRMATEYRVTDKACDGHPATQDWMRWRPENEPVEAPKNTTRFPGGTYRLADGRA
jgi:DNA-binding transcriptional MocR family regulator